MAAIGAASGIPLHYSFLIAILTCLYRRLGGLCSGVAPSTTAWSQTVGHLASKANMGRGPRRGYRNFGTTGRRPIAQEV